jgi:hypothetical protein
VWAPGPGPRGNIKNLEFSNKPLSKAEFAMSSWGPGPLNFGRAFGLARNSYSRSLTVAGDWAAITKYVFIGLGASPGPPPRLRRGPGIDPQGPETRSPGHPERDHIDQTSTNSKHKIERFSTSLARRPALDAPQVVPRSARPRALR